MTIGSVPLPRPGSNGRPAPSSPTPECIDLTERFGRRFRVTYEDSHQASYGTGARNEDPWLKIIPCQNGHVCPWGGDNLAACTRTAGPIAKALKALPFVQVHQDGSDGVNASLPGGSVRGGGCDHAAQTAKAVVRGTEREGPPESSALPEEAP